MSDGNDTPQTDALVERYVMRADLTYIKALMEHGRDLERQLAKARKRETILSSTLDGMDRPESMMAMEIAELRWQVRDARKDTERLDWLTDGHGIYSMPTDDFGEGVDYGEFTRQAINKAMEDKQ